ncbi:Protein T24A6.20 [Aphelenchoides avenae]|nr:Protein T24A6.20 [Aphelenchus avenae]
MSQPPHKSHFEKRFEFVTNPDVAAWEDVVRLTTVHEGWAMSVHDYKVWLDAFGPDNFCLLVALEKGSKELIGSVCSATYPSVKGSKRLTTVGMFFIRPDHRGTGLGMELFNRLLSNPKVADDNKGLTGVPPMAPKYAKVFGFDKFTEWTVYTIKAKISDLQPDKLKVPGGIKVTDPESAGWDRIYQYDAKFVGGVHRDAYLKAWISSPAAHVKVALNSSGEIVGLGVIREAYNKRLSVGPLYAENEATAGAILRSILESIGHVAGFTEMLIWPPSTMKGTVDLMNALTDGKAKNVGHIYVQFTKEKLEVPVENVYGITEYAMSVV